LNMQKYLVIFKAIFCLSYYIYQVIQSNNVSSDPNFELV